MNIDIRRLDPDSAGLLQRIAPDVFDYQIDPAQLQAFLDDDRHIMVIAVDDDTVVGMASAVEYFHPDKDPQMWINEVGVASTHRKQGIGRRLVVALLEVAQERGCESAWLGTDVDNEAAQACFGSVHDGERPQAFLLYEWDLEGLSQSE